MDADPIYLGPQDYSVVWPLLGGFVLVGLLLWLVLVLLITRRPETAGEAPLPPDAVVRLRQEALTRVDEIERAVSSGRMPPRRGHHELSMLVRGFVARTSGLTAHTMTASELRAKGPPHLARAIEEYYPRQFGPAESTPPSITGSARTAREVIGGWARWS